MLGLRIIGNAVLPSQSDFLQKSYNLGRNYLTRLLCYYYFSLLLITSCHSSLLFIFSHADFYVFNVKVLISIPLTGGLVGNALVMKVASLQFFVILLIIIVKASLKILQLLTTMYIYIYF